MIKKSLKNETPVVAHTPAPQIKPERRMKVPMASRALQSGHTIEMDDIALVSLTQKELQEHGIKRAFMTNPEQIMGKKLSTGMKRGETFDTQFFYPTGAGPGITNRIPEGKRAVTVSLTPTNALIGFAGPGQHVDVLFHFHDIVESSQSGSKPFDPSLRNPSGKDRIDQANGGANYYQAVSHRDNVPIKYQSATRTLAQNVEILALGDNSLPTPNASGISTEQRVFVTLAVSPAEAERLRVADGHGELSLTLRGQSTTEHDEIASTRPISIEDIIPMPKPVQLRIPQMEIYRGQKMSVVQFDPRGSISRRIIDSPNAYNPAAQNRDNPASDQPSRQDKSTQLTEQDSTTAESKHPNESVSKLVPGNVFVPASSSEPGDRRHETSDNQLLEGSSDSRTSAGTESYGQQLTPIEWSHPLSGEPQ